MSKESRKKFWNKLVGFIAGIFKGDSAESSKRVIAFIFTVVVCILVLKNTNSDNLVIVLRELLLIIAGLLIAGVYKDVRIRKIDKENERSEV